jgi:hypothetical protein
MELVLEANHDDTEGEDGDNLDMLVKSHLDLWGDATTTMPIKRSLFSPVLLCDSLRTLPMIE